MHRFIALNVPAWRDLERSFGSPALHPFSLLDGLRRLNPGTPSRIEPGLSRLASTLGLHPAQWDCATLRWLHGTAADDTCPTMRFCPACLQAGYHSIVFQFAFLEQCPIHAAPLVSVCAACAAPIAAELDRRALAAPFACSSCGYPLAPLASLLRPPPLDTRAIWTVLRKYRRLRDRLHAVSALTDEAKSWPAFAPAWRRACLDTLDRSAATPPACIRAVRARCGLHLTPSETARVADTASEETQRRTQIYKTYRRHVQNTLPRDLRTVMQRFAAGGTGLWSPARTAHELDRRATAFALLLFRADMEGWSDPFVFNQPVLCQRLARHPFPARSLCTPGFPTRFCPPWSAQGRWLQDHHYAEWIRAQFEERLAHARQMAQTGCYDLCPATRWGRLMPWCVGLRTRAGLEFRAWAPAEGLPTRSETLL